MSNLSIRQIRDILDANGTNYSDCIEKEDFVRKLEQVRSGAKKDSAFHADKGAAPSGGFKGFGGASRNDHNRNDSPPPPPYSSSDSYNHNEHRRSHQRRGSGSKSSGSSSSSGSGSREENNSYSNTDPEAIIKRVSSTTDYYKILGISRSASEEEVKKAYKKLALKLHPDKCKLAGAEEAFKKLAGAFNCLGNADKRSIYDRSGSDPSVGAGGPGAGAIDPNDIFRAFFGQGGMPGGMHFQFGGNGFNGFEHLFQQQHHQQRPRRRQQEEQHVDEQHGLTSLLRFAPIVFLLLPQLSSVVTSVIRSPWMLLPVAFLAPSKYQKPLFAAAAIIFIMNLI